MLSNKTSSHFLNLTISERKLGRVYSFKQRGNKKTARSSEISAFTKKCMLVKNFEMIILS